MTQQRREKSEVECLICAEVDVKLHQTTAGLQQGWWSPSHGSDKEDMVPA